MVEIQRLIKLSDAVRESTISRLKLVNNKYYNWRPKAVMMSFADIAYHIIETDSWLIKKVGGEILSSISGEANAIDIASEGDYTKLLNDLKRSGVKRAEFIRSISEEKLSNKIYDDRFDGEVTVWWLIVRGNFDHEIHHRGQLAVYLRIAGIK